ARGEHRPGAIRKDFPPEHAVGDGHRARHDVRRVQRRAASAGRNAREHGGAPRRRPRRPHELHTAAHRGVLPPSVDRGAPASCRSARPGRLAYGAVPDNAIEIDAGGRALRVSNPDRVIFPRAGRRAKVTKLQVVEYYLAVAPGIMRALRERPTTLERWPKGVHPGMVLSTREKGGGDAFFQKRIPRGAPPYVETARIQFPSGRWADEICPTATALVACV